MGAAGGTLGGLWGPMEPQRVPRVGAGLWKWRNKKKQQRTKTRINRARQGAGWPLRYTEKQNNGITATRATPAPQGPRAHWGCTGISRIYNWSNRVLEILILAIISHGALLIVIVNISNIIADSVWNFESIIFSFSSSNISNRIIVMATPW